MELSEFQENCNNKKCLKRQRWDSKTCIRTSKQTNCHKSYERLEAKKEINRNELSENQIETREQLEQVWLRDSGQGFDGEKKKQNWKSICRLWRVLNPVEKVIVDNDPENYMNQFLDMAHIKPKSVYPEEKYLVENVLLIGSLFHKRLTNLRHPVLDTPITNEEVYEWMIKARDNGYKVSYRK